MCEVYGHDQGPARTSAQEAQYAEYGAHEVYGIDPVHQGLISCHSQIGSGSEQAQGRYGFVDERTSISLVTSYPEVSGGL